MRNRMGRSVLAAAVVAALAAGVVGVVVVRGSGGSATGASTYRPGADGVGDPYFPLAGNGGYDVGHYDLALAYDPAGHTLTGTASITATATQNLSRFDLDLSGMQVRSV